MQTLTQSKKFPIAPPPDEVDVSVDDYELDSLVKFYHRYGDLFQLPPLAHKTPIYIVSNPVWVKHVLSTNHMNYTKGIGIDRVRILLGNGLMASEGQHWHSQRKMIQPAFHPSRLAGFNDIMQQSNHDLYKTWQQKANAGESVNITEDMSQLTLNFILKAIFSDDLQTLIHSQGDNPFAIVSEETARNLQFAVQFRKLTKTVAEIVADRRANNRRPYDFLSHLMDARNRKTDQPMADKDIINEAMTLIVAGHETTASALNWAWYLISQHPDVEAKLLQEANNLTHGRIPNFDELEELPYAKQVVLETIRLYPPGWLLTRRAIDEDEIDGCYVPAKTNIGISPYIVHRNKNYWDNPQQFNPERFTDNNIAKRHRFAYIPFAAGPRNCIGDFLATCEMQMHLAFMLQHFHLSYDNKQAIELEARVNLRPKHALIMNIQVR